MANETIKAIITYTTPLGRNLSLQSSELVIEDTSVGEWVIDLANYTPMFVETALGYNGIKIYGSPNFWSMLTTLAGGAENITAGDKVKIIVPSDSAVVGRYNPFPVSGSGGANYPIAGGRDAIVIGSNFDNLNVVVEIAGLVIGYGGGGNNGGTGVAATGGTGINNASASTVIIDILSSGQLCGGGGGGGSSFKGVYGGGGAPYGPGGGGGTAYTGTNRDAKFFAPGLGADKYHGGNWGLPGDPGTTYGKAGYCYQGSVNLRTNSGQLMGRIP